MFDILDKVTAGIKNKVNETVSNSLDLATETLISGKDSTHSIIIKKGMNLFIKKFGEIQDFSIDSLTKSIKISVNLKGEDSEIEININSYKFFKNDDDVYYIEIFEVSVNRYWIDEIMQLFVINKQFPIPNQLVVPLKILM